MKTNKTLYAKWVEAKATHVCPSASFSDLDTTKWYHEDVDYVLDNKIMLGTSDTEFDPEGSLTRGMLVTILYRSEGEPATNKSIPFADVDMGSYYANAVSWAKQNGIVSGVTENEFAPNANITREQIATIMFRYAQYKGMDAVITQGFIATNLKGEQTVLGRGGSDYSASLIGMAIDAERIEIWTDVDGVRTADPRYVQNTKYLEKISFEEAAEMAHFGAKVLHPLTIEPAVKKNIPIYVLNSMNPSGKGTAILRSELIEDGVKSVSFKENIRVINIFSMKMINTSGFLRRVFEIFSESRVSVDLISTSEANISVTVDASEKIDKVVEQLSEFADVIVDDDKSQVSVIGKNIVRLNGMLKKTFAPLKRTNVYMISQGASFVNISFVVDREELKEVVKDLHYHLFEVEEELEQF